MLRLFATVSRERLVFFLLLAAALIAPPLTMNWPESPEYWHFLALSDYLLEGKLLYAEVWDDTSWLFAYLFASINYLGQNSITFLQILGALLLFLSALRFGMAINRFTQTSQSNMLPALISLVLVLMAAPNWMLSPILLATLFQVLALYRMLKSFNKGADDEEFMLSGFFYGLSALVLFPTLFLGIAQILTFLILSNKTIRSVAYYIFGLLVPLLLLLLVYYLMDKLPELMGHFVLAHLQAQPLHGLSSISVVIKLGIMAFLLLISIPSISGRTSYHVQNLKNYSMGIYLLMVVLVSLFWLEPADGALLLTLPTTYFFTLRINTTGTGFINEALFLTVLGGLLVYSYHQAGKERSLPDNEVLRGQRVWVVNGSYEKYYQTEPCTPYLNPKLSQEHLDKLHDPYMAIAFYRNFIQDKPVLIYDNGQAMEKIDRYLPLIRKDYVKLDAQLYKIKQP